MAIADMHVPSSFTHKAEQADYYYHNEADASTWLALAPG